MKRSVISASALIFSLGFLVSACGSGDTSSGAGGGTGGGFPQGGAFPGGGGTSPGAGGAFPGGGGTSPLGNGGAIPGGGGASPGAGGAIPGGGGASPGAGGAIPGGGGASPGAGGSAPAEKPPCITDGATQAAIIGDSYVTGAASPALQPALATLDPGAASYKNYAVPGTSLASGGILGLIPPQLDQALAPPAKPVFSIMDGGGNDILICDGTKYPNCSTLCSKAGSSTQKVCQDIAQAAFDAATAMMQKAATAGVKDVVYFFYPHIPDLGPGNGGFDEILDYAEPKAKALCDAAITNTGGKLACHFVSTKAAFIAAGGDKNPANFVADGIHPSAAGQAIIAGLIWDTMKADCLGQASGCCQ